MEGARIIVGAAPPTLELPWCWSDQYDLKLSTAGLIHGFEAAVTRGEPATRAFARFYYRGERLIAVDAVNRQADYLGAKLAMQRGVNLPAKAFIDDARPMHEIVAAAR